MKMGALTYPSKRTTKRLLGWAVPLLVVLATLAACRPVNAPKQDAMLQEADQFLASGRKWSDVERTDAGLDVLEAAGMRHVETVRSLLTMDVQMREFEVARVYARLRMIARAKGLKDKEAEYEKEAVEAFRRSGAPSATATMVDALERRL